MPKLKLKLPKGILDLPEEHRREIVGVVEEALRLPQRISVHTAGGNEHNMWSRSGDPLLGDAEDEFYHELLKPAQVALADVFVALDLPHEGIDLEKAFTPEFREYEGLLKSKNRGKQDILDTIKVSRQQRDDFVKYIQDGNAWTKKQLKRIDDILKKPLPSYAKIAEQFMTRAAFIAKVRNVADKEFFDTVGAFIDRYPETIQAAEKTGVVLTLREKQKAASEGRRVKVLPLTPLEKNSVTMAEHHCADKLTEISERHRAGVRQLVIRAQKERWSPQKLAQELFDAYGDQNRDWRRVAITELAMATNDAYLLGCDEGDEVVGMGAEGACKHCKNLLIGKKFTVTHKLPKETYDHEMNFVWAGKSNYGRSVASYIPAAPMHPHCRCRWHKLSRFYNVDKDGNMVRKTTAELIQEERKRRGLPPDPNLKTG